MNISLFSKRKDDILIELVRANRILYDSHHDHFRNLIMKHQIWENISKELEIPLVDVKKRWRHFRDHYLKKRRQYEAGLARGKMWEYMPQLEFLAYTRARELRLDSAADEEEPALAPDDSSQNSDESDADESPAPAEPPRKRVKAETAAPRAEEPQSSTQPVYIDCEVKRPPDVARLLMPDEKSPIHKFFDSMADIVAQFPPRLAAETRLRVCQLVTEMEMQLQNNDPILANRHYNVKLE